MIVPLIHLVAASSMMPRAARVHHAPRLGVVPHAMAGRMMHHCPMVHAQINYPHPRMQTVESEDDALPQWRAKIKDGRFSVSARLPLAPTWKTPVPGFGMDNLDEATAVGPLEVTQAASTGGNLTAGKGSKQGKRAAEDTGLEQWDSRIQASIAQSRKIEGGNYVQIATVDGEGLPRCRTVVFRGFQQLSHRPGQSALRMITDARSEKVDHIRCSPACEMVWWFAKSKEQYRFAGDLQLIGPDAEGDLQAARKQQWNNLSDLAREQFFWVAPGPFSGAAEPPPTGGRDQGGKVLSPPDNFCLLLLWPSQVKYLRLSDNYAQLDRRSSESGKWSLTRQNP